MRSLFLEHWKKHKREQTIIQEPRQSFIIKIFDPSDCSSTDGICSITENENKSNLLDITTFSIAIGILYDKISELEDEFRLFNFHQRQYAKIQSCKRRR
jgi:hypothetical protein